MMPNHLFPTTTVITVAVAAITPETTTATSVSHMRDNLGEGVEITNNLPRPPTERIRSGWAIRVWHRGPKMVKQQI
jgi:hypothetical protein